VERDPNVFTLQVRLADIFGDNGMISVVICRPAGNEAWEIDTWLMSCRVLGRKVEHMVLRKIVDLLRELYTKHSSKARGHCGTHTNVAGSSEVPQW
jgi:predicted enzyme involved in methoxymalonyl-ACP biosynthesis